MTIEKIPLTYEELEDENSERVTKHRGIALNRIEKAVAEKINEIVDHLNRD